MIPTDADWLKAQRREAGDHRPGFFCLFLNAGGLVYLAATVAGFAFGVVAGLKLHDLSFSTITQLSHTHDRPG